MSLKRVAIAGLTVSEGDPTAHGLALNAPLTWSIWACLPNLPTGTTVRSVFSFCTVTVGSAGYNLMALNSKTYFYLRTTPPSTWQILPAINDVVAGEWHHYAGRVYVDAGYLNVEFYIDGVLQDSRAIYPAPNVKYAGSGVEDINIGAYLSAKLDCLVQDFAIWDVALSQAEIRWIANSKQAGAATMFRPGNIKGFWAFDEWRDGENASTNPKYIRNRSNGSGGYFMASGAGSAYGGPIPLSYSHSARLVTIDAAGPPQGIDLGALTLASAARSLVVSPGGVSILMQPASGSIWVDGFPWDGGGLIIGAIHVTVAAGETLRAMGALGLTGTLKSLQVIPGELVTALSVLTSTGQAQTVATTTGPVTLLLNRALLTSSAATVGVSFGEFITRLSALAAQLSIPSIGVIPGEKITALSDLVLSATGRQLTVEPGEMVTSMDALALASGVGAVVIVPGGASIPMDVLTLASYIPILVTTNGVAIHLSPLHLTGSPGSVTVSTGPVSVMATVLSLGSSIPALHLYSIKRTDMAALVAVFMPQGVSVVPGATARGMSPVTLVTSIPQLDVAPGEAFQLMDSLLLTGTPMRATVPRDVQVLLDAVTATLYATNTRGMFGVRIFMNPAQITAAAVAIGTIGGILLIPDGRRIAVLGENRLMIVSDEERIFVVPAEM